MYCYTLNNSIMKNNYKINNWEAYLRFLQSISDPISYA